jgi:hypothetical protein
MLLRRSCTVPLALAVLLAVAANVCVTAPTKEKGLTQGTPTLKSAGPLAFGPPGILFIGDPQGAAIFAVDTSDRTPAGNGRPRVEGLDEKIAALLGIEAKQLLVNDMAVNPASGNTYLSVSRGRGPDARPAIVRVDRAGKVGEFSLKDVPHSQVALSNPAAGEKRRDAITHLAYVNNRLVVAGLSSEEFSSKLRTLPYPFTTADPGANVEIFHGSHGRLETNSPVRTFTAYDIDGEPNLLAAYTCTPLVKVPLASLKPGAKVRGTTVAELGNMNRPLDMFVYRKGGKDYVLMANSARGVMKVSLEGIANAEGINAKVTDKAGLKYETIKGLKDVKQLDRFDEDHALVLIQPNGGGMTLETIELP